jgi:hypothetical protein
MPPFQIPFFRVVTSILPVPYSVQSIKRQNTQERKIMIANVADMQALKARQKAMWMSGDYAKFATYMVDGALCKRSGCRLRRRANGNPAGPQR